MESQKMSKAGAIVGFFFYLFYLAIGGLMLFAGFVSICKALNL